MVAGVAHREWDRSVAEYRSPEPGKARRENRCSRGRHSMNTEPNVRRDRGPVIGGVVFIVIGTVLLLEKLGYLPYGFVLHFWPTIFIVIGLVKIVYAGGRATGAALIALGGFLQL